MHRVSPKTHASLKYLLAVRGKFTAEKIKSEMLRLITNAVVACRLSLVYFNNAITVTKLPNTPITLNIIAQVAAKIVTERAYGLKSSFKAISKIVLFAAKSSIFLANAQETVFLPSHSSENKKSPWFMCYLSRNSRDRTNDPRIARN